jgi:two-component system, NarL family, invasion response regulator UvrY
MTTSPASRKRLRILITEDHASTRLGIKQILREEYPRVECGEAADEAETLARLAEGAWDVLLLDITLPGRSGLEILREVRKRRPELPVLVYSAHREEEFAFHVLRAGAAGYLSKERAPEELCAAVQHILRGGIYFSQSFSQRLAKLGERAPVGLPHEVLSPREFQVLRLIAKGTAGKTVAAELGLSEKTVSTYRRRILQKLKLGNTSQLIQFALREGLL